MKDSTTPRRVYTRNDVIHVCFAGKTFAPPTGETTIKVGSMVKVEIQDDGSAKVRFARGKQKAVIETWKAKKVPCHPREA